MVHTRNHASSHGRFWTHLTPHKKTTPSSRMLEEEHEWEFWQDTRFPGRLVTHTKHGVETHALRSYSRRIRIRREQGQVRTTTKKTSRDLRGSGADSRGVIVATQVFISHKSDFCSSCRSSDIVLLSRVERRKRPSRRNHAPFSTLRRSFIQHFSINLLTVPHA